MMPATVRTFSFEGLPWIPRDAADRARRAGRWIAGLPERGVSKGLLGLVRVGVSALDLDPGTSSPVGEAPVTFAVVRGDELGLLRLERGLARACLDAVLGMRLPRLSTPLGRVERGVVSVAAAAVLDALGVTAHASLSLAPPAHGGADRTVRFVGTLAFAGGKGPFAWDMPVAWLALPPPQPRLGRLAGAAVHLSADIATTTLSRAQWASAELGDAVVFDGCPRFETDRGWPCVARLGPRSAPAILEVDGSLRLHAGFEDAPAPRREQMSLDRDTRKPSSSDDVTATPPTGRDDRADPVATLPVEVVAEIGQVQLRADEALGLVSGSVIALGARRRDAVLLRVGGRPWARGELVNIDDELGVRITALLDDR